MTGDAIRGPDTVLIGTVTGFDQERGLGTVTDTDGGRWPFHCTELTDGTRTVAEGTRVGFVAAPGHGGRLEARQLTAVG
ncbi:MAG: hypothetical protein ACYDD4_10350 [Acidimicrobiales bacterium]